MCVKIVIHFFKSDISTFFHFPKLVVRKYVLYYMTDYVVYSRKINETHNCRQLWDGQKQITSDVFLIFDFYHLQITGNKTFLHCLHSVNHKSHNLALSQLLFNYLPSHSSKWLYQMANVLQKDKANEIRNLATSEHIKHNLYTPT